MRLYVVIPNYVFFEKVMGNSEKLGSIVVDDLSGTYQDMFRYDMAPFLEYSDKEELVDNSICCFTTPREARTFLADNNIMISFEAEDNKALLFNANQFEKYLLKKSYLESLLISNIEDGEKVVKIQSQINDHAARNLSKVYNLSGYYDSFAVVEDIPVNSVKCFFISKSNKKIETFKKLQNYNFEFVSNGQRGQENVF